MSDNVYQNDPSLSPLAAFRFKICDTRAPFFFSDKELEFLLAEANDNLPMACLAACRKQATHFAKCVDKSIGKVRISYSQRFKQARELCEELEELVRCQGAEIFVGGLEQKKCGGPKNPVFSLGQFDNNRSDEGNFSDNEHHEILDKDH